MRQLFFSRMMVRQMLALVGATVLFAAQSQAGFITSAQSVVSAPPAIGAFTFDRTIDQSGLSIGYVSGVTDFNTYVSSSPIHTRNNTLPNYAASFSLPPQNVDYDLGSTYGVQQLAFWNYPFQSSAGVTSFDVFTSSVSNFSSSFFAGSFLPLDDGNSSTNAVQVFDIADSTARFVRLRVTGTASSNATGFSEIAFDTAAPSNPVPAPAGLLLVGSGLPMLAGLVWRRRPTPLPS